MCVCVCVCVHVSEETGRGLGRRPTYQIRVNPFKKLNIIGNPAAERLEPEPDQPADMPSGDPVLTVVAYTGDGHLRWEIRVQATGHRGTAAVPSSPRADGRSGVQHARCAAVQHSAVGGDAARVRGCRTVGSSRRTSFGNAIASSAARSALLFGVRPDEDYVGQSQAVDNRQCIERLAIGLYFHLETGQDEVGPLGVLQGKSDFARLGGGRSDRSVENDGSGHGPDTGSARRGGYLVQDFRSYLQPSLHQANEIGRCLFLGCW